MDITKTYRTTARNIVAGDVILTLGGVETRTVESVQAASRGWTLIKFAGDRFPQKMGLRTGFTVVKKEATEMARGAK